VQRSNQLPHRTVIVDQLSLICQIESQVTGRRQYPAAAKRNAVKGVVSNLNPETNK